MNYFKQIFANFLFLPLYLLVKYSLIQNVEIEFQFQSMKNK
jgi:hypothetical protein